MIWRALGGGPSLPFQHRIAYRHRPRLRRRSDHPWKGNARPLFLLIPRWVTTHALAAAARRWDAGKRGGRTGNPNMDNSGQRGQGWLPGRGGGNQWPRRHHERRALCDQPVRRPVDQGRARAMSRTPGALFRCLFCRSGPLIAALSSPTRDISSLDHFDVPANQVAPYSAARVRGTSHESLFTLSYPVVGADPSWKTIRWISERQPL